MQMITGNQLQGLSFPDAVVLKFEIDVETKDLKIAIDLAFFEQDGIVTELGEGTLNIRNWRSAKSMRFHSNDERWENLDLSDGEKLRDMCEVSFSSTVILRGFGRSTGLWNEYTFDHALVEYAEN